MVDASGYFFMDGMDLWVSFNLIIEEGSTEFLRWAPKKDSITHDWQDSHGIDVDLSRYFFKERVGTLRMGIIVDTEVDFWLKYDAFVATLTQPGTRRLTFKSHGDRSYYVFYKETNAWTQVLPLEGKDEAIFGPNKVAAKFSITVIEPEPQVNASLIYIIDEDDRFLVT